MGIFLVKYVVGVDLAMAPQLVQEAPYVLTVAALYGAFTGIFVGRASRLWRLWLRRAHLDHETAQPAVHGHAAHGQRAATLPGIKVKQAMIGHERGRHASADEGVACPAQARCLAPLSDGQTSLAREQFVECDLVLQRRARAGLGTALVAGAAASKASSIGPSRCDTRRRVNHRRGEWSLKDSQTRSSPWS